MSAEATELAGRGKYRLFLLNHEEDEQAQALGDLLTDAGFAEVRARTALGAGTRLERNVLLGSHCIILLFGKHGWSETQADLLRLARKASRPVVTVLAPGGAVDELRYEDPAAEKGLVIALGTHPGERRDELLATIDSVLVSSDRASSLESDGFSDIVRTIVDGKESERAELLDQLIELGHPQAAELAEELRRRVFTDFAPTRERLLTGPPRDPNKFPSVRSWMISFAIWLEPDPTESRIVIARHLDPSYEPQAIVRFWTLATAISARAVPADWLYEVTRSDPAAEVADLARAAHEGGSASLLRDFEADLHSEQFLSVWHILRILRVVPLPALAPHVVALIGREAERSQLTYDALFALAHPAMIEAAREHILETVGLDRLAGFAVREAMEAADTAVRAFAHLLGAFDREEVDEALLTAAGTPSEARAAERIRGFLPRAPGIGGDNTVLVAGYSSETIDVRHDDLGIAREVETLAAVMLSKDVEPPLAVGLFGPWGSGKSFFMKSIKAAADRISARERERKTQAQRFCAEVVQIEFNAWHYTDGHLWASLVNHILSQLSDYVTPETTVAQKEEKLATDLDGERRKATAAENAKLRAHDERAIAEAELAAEQARRETRAIGLRDVGATELAAIFSEQPEVEGELRSALGEAGAPAEVNRFEDLERAVGLSFSLAARTAGLFRALLKPERRRLVWSCVAVVLVAPVLIGVAVHVLAAQIAWVAALMTGFVAMAGSIVKLVGEAAPAAAQALDRVSQAKAKVDALVAQKRAEPGTVEEDLQARVSEAAKAEAAAADRLAQSLERIARIERELDALREQRTLGHFLADRSRSEDYRRHLGLMSIIRRDFDDLVARLARQEKGGKKVERIVLYIDDLDRCPAKTVIEVLQAVHLLLAYPLFVVVVSVDPRWLLRSLEASYSHFCDGRSVEDDAWVTRPQDYLEKIFQIPFSVQEMAKGGFSSLMHRLLAPAGGGAPRPAPRPAIPPGSAESLKPGASEDAPGEAPARQLDRQGAATAEREEQPDGKVGVSGGRGVTEAEPAAAPEILDEAMVIRDWEAAFASRLHDFIPTPRAAKRFANIYRLLKAPLDRAGIGRHEGSAEQPGEFRLPMLLLALLVGRPAEAGPLFAEFLANAKAGREDFWRGSRGKDASLPRGERLEQVRGRIAAIAGEPGFPRSPALVASWLPRVARFSFVTAGMRGAPLSGSNEETRGTA